jgi:thiol:disulfide interchange protein
MMRNCCFLLVLSASVVVAWGNAPQWAAAADGQVPPDSVFSGGGPPSPTGAGATGLGPAQDAQVAVRAGFTKADANGRAVLFITATIQPGWHIYSITQATGGPQASKIVLGASGDYTRIGDFQVTPAPDAKIEPIFDNLKVETHHGTVHWYAPIQFRAGVDPAKVLIPGTLHVQVCLGSERCEQKDVAFVAGLSSTWVYPQRAPWQSAGQSAPTAPSPPKKPSAPSVWQIEPGKLAIQLWFAFWGGMILNFMPCVLPVISLKIFSFLEQGGESRARVFTLNVWYSVGVMSVFMVLAVLAAKAGQVGKDWGEQFTLPWFKVALIGLVFAMALSFLGVWEIPIPGFMGTGRANQLQAREGVSGAFFKGVFATVLATPCSGPLLASTFAYVAMQPPIVAYGVFAAMGLGMAAPYLVLGAFPKLVRYLPKPGAWMETLKQVMGFFLLGTVVWLCMGLRSAYFIPTLAFLLVGVWFGAWLVGRTPPTASPRRRAAAWGAAICWGGLVAWLTFTLLLVESKLAWQPFSPESLAKARQEGKTVLIDFSANWCATCKWNLKFAVETDEVRKLIQQNRVLPMLADWTDESPVIKEALNALGYHSIPLLVIYPADRPADQKPLVLADLVRESEVLDALRQAGPSRP